MSAMLVLVTVVLALLGGFLPTPIGPGPSYRPAAAPPPAAVPCRTAPMHAGARVHLELFGNRRAVVVPPAIGLRRPRLVLGRVVAARCRARIWTLDPSGVVRFTGRAWLGDVFRVWGRALGPRRLVSFHGRVRVYVGGRAWHGDPRGLELRDGAEIVLEVRGYVPPHRSFLFPRRPAHCGPGVPWRSR